MNRIIRTLVLIVSILLITPGLFAGGERERTKSEIRDLIDEGDFSAAMQVIIDRYENTGNSEEFDLWFIQESSDIIRIERKYTKLVNEFTRILNKGQENITETDLEELYEIIVQMTELKPIPPEEARDFITQARRIAGGIANGKKLNKLMNETLVVLDTPDYPAALAKYMGGFSLNRDVFDESEFPADIVKSVDDSLSTLNLFQADLIEMQANLDALSNTFYEQQAMLPADGLGPLLSELLDGMDTIAEIRKKAAGEGKNITTIEDNVLDEFGTVKDIYYFRFLDFLINGRNEETKIASGVSASVTEGVEAVFSRLWLDYGKPLLALVRKRISDKLRSADVLFDAGDFPAALADYEEAAKMAEHLFPVLVSWQRYLLIQPENMITETEGTLVYDDKVDDIVMANYLYAGYVSDLFRLQGNIGTEYGVYADIRNRSEQTDSLDALIRERSLLNAELGNASAYLAEWNRHKQVLAELGAKGFYLSEAQAMVESGLSRINDLIQKNHENEDYIAARIFNREMDPLFEHYSRVTAGISEAESVRQDFTVEEVSDLADGFVYVNYAYSSEKKYLTHLNSVNALLVKIGEIKDSKGQEPDYIQAGTDFTTAKARFSMLEQNAEAARQNILDSLKGIDFERAEGLATALAEKIRYDFEAQKEILDKARAALKDPDEQELQTIGNTGSRELQAMYPVTSRDLIDSISDNLKKINIHVQAMNEYMQKTMADYRSSEIVESSLVLVQTVHDEANAYVSNLDNTRNRIDEIFSINSAQVRYDAVYDDYRALSGDFEKALGMSDKIIEYKDESLEGTDPVFVRYAAESDSIAAAVSAGMNNLLDETGFILSVFDNEPENVIADSEFQTVVRKTRSLQSSLRSGINEADSFLFTQRRLLADASAKARADQIETKMNEYQALMRDEAGIEGVASTRSIAYEGIPEVNVEYNFNSLQIYRDSLDGLADLYRQGTVIIDDLKSSPYFYESEVLRPQSVRIAALQDDIKEIQEESHDFEYILERNFKIRYAEELYNTLNKELAKVEQLYADAAEAKDKRTVKKKADFDDDRDLSISAEYSQYSAEKMESALQDINPLIDQLKNSLNLLQGPEFTAYKKENDEITASTGNITDMSAAAADLRTRTENLAAEIENDYIERIYTERRDILGERIADLQETYTKIEQLLEGEETEERVDGQTIKVIKKHPDQVQKLLRNVPAETKQLLADLESLNAELLALPPEQKKDERVNQLLAGFTEQSRELSALSRNLSEARESSYTQDEKAAGYKLQGDRYYDAAMRDMERENYTSVRKNLDLASVNYQNSLDLKWDSEIFQKQQIEVISIRQELVDRQRVLVEREISDLLIQVNSSYRIGDYQDARKALNSAEKRWEDVFYDIENEEIIFWSDLIQNALRTSTGRVVSKNDAQYDTISNLLDQARQDYLSGQNMYRINRKKDGQKYFDAAIDKIDAVLNLFPINKEANVLALRIEKIINPNTWNDYLDKEFTAAVAVSMRDPVSALSRFEDIRELDPGYPGLDEQILKMEYATGKRVRTDVNKQAQAAVEYKKAKKIYDSGSNNVTQLNTALGYIATSIKLNPGNDEALYLRNLILEKMAKIGAKPTSGVKIAKLSTEDRRILNDIIVLYSSGSYTDLTKAWSMFEELEQKGDNRNNPDVRRLGVEIRKALGI